MRTLRNSICALALVAVLAAIAAPARAASGDPFVAAATRLESALRNAIERQPEGLLMSVTSGERICEVGERAEARGDAAGAEADWSALDQVVGVFAEPELLTVRRALGEARHELAAAERQLRRAWARETRRLRVLASATKRVRTGIDQVTASLGTLQSAFAAWRERHCEAGLAGTATSNQQARAGVEAIGIGMQRLWIVGTSRQGSR